MDRRLALSEFVHTNWSYSEIRVAAGIDAVGQTNDGYLWLGTSTGLVRFDGARFTAAPRMTGATLPDNRIRTLSTDASGSLWIGTNSGIGRLANGELRTYTSKDGLPAGPVIAVVPSLQDGVWVATTGAPSSGVALIQNQVVETRRHGDTAGASVLSMAGRSKGGVWLGTTAGVVRLGATGFELEPATSDKEVFAVAEDVNGNLVIGDRVAKEVSILNLGPQPKSKLVSHYPHFTPRVMMRDRDGNLWIGTLGAGLFRLRDGITERLSRRDGLSADYVNALFEDKDGNVWIGTENGLDRLSNPSMARVPQLGTLNTSFITVAEASRDGSVWLGTANSGVARLHNGVVSWPRVGLPASTIISLFEDKAGVMWVGTTRGLVYWASDRFTEVLTKDGAPLDRICSITGDRQRNLWVADGKRGLFRVSGRTAERVEAAPSRGVYTVHAAQDGALWVGYYQGGIIEIRPDRVITHSAGIGSVQSIHEESNGTIWAGGTGALSRYRNSRWTKWTTNEGIPREGVYGIIADGGDGLWAMSGQGLLHFFFADLDRSPDGSPKYVMNTVVGRSEGIRLAEERRAATPRSTRSADGRLWIVTSSGLATVDGYTTRRRDPPPALIERVSVGGTNLGTGPFPDLSVRGGSLQFEYTAINLTAPESIRFRYMLEGLDRGWIEAGSIRQVSYGALPVGRYRFRAVARDGFSPWEPVGASVSFEIKPLFYQTWWFLAVSVTIVAAGLFGLHRLRMWQVRYGMQIMFQERLRVTRELHDSLIQGFTGVVYQLAAGQRLMDITPLETKKHLDRALQQADQALKDARYAITQLRLPALEKHSLAEALTIAAKKLVEGTSIALHLDLQPGASNLLPYEIQADLFVIAREAICNAATHSGASTIALSISYTDDRYRMQVRDDGRGFDTNGPAPEGHFGLASMRERAERIKAGLTIDSTPGNGTTLTLRGTHRGLRRAGRSPQ